MILVFFFLHEFERQMDYSSLNMNDKCSNMGARKISYKNGIALARILFSMLKIKGVLF